MQLLAFEGFRDLVNLSVKGLTEAEGIEYARLENIEIRAKARAEAAEALAAAQGQRKSEQQVMATLAGWSMPMPMPNAPASHGSYRVKGHRGSISTHLDYITYAIS